jgi:hypothetical protein
MFARRLAMAGVDLRTLAGLMGHQTIQMTMRYAHLAPSHTLAAVERLVSQAGPERSSVSAVECLRNGTIGPVAQRLEPWTHNPLVPGSNPGGPTSPFRSKKTRGQFNSSVNGGFRGGLNSRLLTGIGARLGMTGLLGLK